MEIYLVGGAVRDSLLNYPSSENDWVVVGATPEQMTDQGFKPVGQDFPVFIHPKSSEEYALARTERKSGHGYKGFEFYTSIDVSLEEDLIRRDLTINAMAQDNAVILLIPLAANRILKKSACAMFLRPLLRIHCEYCELQDLPHAITTLDLLLPVKP